MLQNELSNRVFQLVLPIWFVGARNILLSLDVLQIVLFKKCFHLRLSQPSFQICVWARINNVLNHSNGCRATFQPTSLECFLPAAVFSIRFFSSTCRVRGSLGFGSCCWGRCSCRFHGRGQTSFSLIDVWKSWSRLLRRSWGSCSSFLSRNWNDYFSI